MRKKLLPCGGNLEKQPEYVAENPKSFPAKRDLFHFAVAEGCLGYIVANQSENSIGNLANIFGENL